MYQYSNIAAHTYLVKAYDPFGHTTPTHHHPRSRPLTPLPLTPYLSRSLGLPLGLLLLAPSPSSLFPRRSTDHHETIVDIRWHRLASRHRVANRCSNTPPYKHILTTHPRILAPAPRRGRPPRHSRSPPHRYPQSQYFDSAVCHTSDPQLCAVLFPWLK